MDKEKVNKGGKKQAKHHHPFSRLRTKFRR